MSVTRLDRQILESGYLGRDWGLRHQTVRGHQCRNLKVYFAPRTFHCHPPFEDSGSFSYG
jgi:hypothetical protein